MFSFDQLCDPDLKQEVAAHIVASGNGGTRRQKLWAWLCGRKVKTVDSGSLYYRFRYLRDTIHNPNCLRERERERERERRRRRRRDNWIFTETNI